MSKVKTVTQGDGTKCLVIQAGKEPRGFLSKAKDGQCLYKGRLYSFYSSSDTGQNEWYAVL